MGKAFLTWKENNALGNEYFPSKKKKCTSGRNHTNCTLCFDFVLISADKCEILEGNQPCTGFLIGSTINWGFCALGGGWALRVKSSRAFPASLWQKGHLSHNLWDPTPGSQKGLLFCLWPCKLFGPMALDKFRSWSFHHLTATVSKSHLCLLVVRKLCRGHTWPIKHDSQNFPLRNQLLIYPPILSPRGGQKMTWQKPQRV